MGESKVISFSLKSYATITKVVEANWRTQMGAVKPIDRYSKIGVKSQQVFFSLDVLIVRSDAIARGVIVGNIFTNCGLDARRLSYTQRTG